VYQTGLAGERQENYRTCQPTYRKCLPSRNPNFLWTTRGQNPASLCAALSTAAPPSFRKVDSPSFVIVSVSEICPRREWSALARRDIDEARRVSECASESIEPTRRTNIKHVGRRRVKPCPRRESNPHLRFRKPSFYPLNYGDCCLPDTCAKAGLLNQMSST
jgi:hypothetical protein